MAIPGDNYYFIQPCDCGLTACKCKDKSLQSPVQQGWQCPVCQSVMAPLQPSCVHCAPAPTVTTTTDTYATTDDDVVWSWI